jgi:hypothetical protein
LIVRANAFHILQSNALGDLFKELYFSNRLSTKQYPARLLSKSTSYEGGLLSIEGGDSIIENCSYSASALKRTAENTDQERDCLG